MDYESYDLIITNLFPKTVDTKFLIDLLRDNQDLYLVIEQGFGYDPAHTLPILYQVLGEVPNGAKRFRVIYGVDSFNSKVADEHRLQTWMQEMAIPYLNDILISES